MRTTLTIDDDLSTRLQRVQADTGLSFKELVNTLLRRSLPELEQPRAPRPTYHITPVSTGAPIVDLTRSAELTVLDDEADWRQEAP